MEDTQLRIDWTKALRPVSDHSYRILVVSVGDLFVTGTLVDQKHKQIGLLTWDRGTGILFGAGRAFPYSGWCAENIPDVAPAGKDVDTIRTNFNCYTGPTERFSREDVRTLLQAIDDRDEVLEDHKRLVREIDVAINGEKSAAPQASLVDILAQLSTIAAPRLLLKRFADLGRQVLGLTRHGRYFEKPHTPESIAGKEHAELRALVVEADFLVGLYDRIDKKLEPLTDIIKVRSRPECSLEVCPNPQACAERCQTPAPTPKPQRTR